MDPLKMYFLLKMWMQNSIAMLPKWGEKTWRLTEVDPYEEKVRTMFATQVFCKNLTLPETNQHCILNIGFLKRKVVSQPPFFRGELFC